MRGCLVVLWLAGCAERALPLPDDPGASNPGGDLSAPGGVDLAPAPLPLGAPCADGAQCQSGECGAGVCACSRTVCGGACVDLASDGDNCGACGHGCAGDGCAGGLCRAVTMLDNQARPYAVAADETDVYLRNYDESLLRMSVRGVAVTVVASGTGTAGSHGLALDGAYVYFTDLDGGNVSKIPRAGGAPISIATGQHFPDPIAIDGKNVYWLDTYDSSVVQAPLGGGTPSVLVTHPFGSSSLATITSDGSYVYWMSDYLQRVPVGGGSAVKLLNYSFSESTFVLYGNNIYFADTEAGGGMVPISRIANSGGASTLITPGQQLIAFIATDGVNLYYTTTDEFEGELRRVPIGGGTPTVLAEKQHQPGAIALNSTYVFWVEEGGSGFGALHRMAK